MGDFETLALAIVESPVKYHPVCRLALTWAAKSRGYRSEVFSIEFFLTLISNLYHPTSIFSGPGTVSGG